MRVVGIDTGGTFTDFILFDGRRIRTHKVLSTPDDPSRAVLQGLRELGAEDAAVVHGSTVATNAFLERKGATITLVTTKGFEDLLEIGRQDRGALYDLNWERPEPLVPRSRRIGVAERMDVRGKVLRPLDRAALRRVKAEHVAVCFLNSYANPKHEREAGKVLRGATLSSEVLPEYREYERLSTTVLNAYVAPAVSRYVGKLQRSIRTLRILASDGGAITPESAGRRAAQTLLSGPAGGVIAAQSLGFGKVIAFDMGGTSTDVCLIDGTARVTKEGSIGGMPLRVPHFEIHTVGAGGGSIARIDEGGALRVGPESAGANPGPICYGRGGKLPTVTDANVKLGRIDPERFLGGRMKLEASELSREFAEGVIEVVNANMERALRKVSIERGHDPADFWLVSYGGAGGLHACDLAGRLEMKGVVVPRWPGLFSALGMVLADMTVEKSRTVLGGAIPWSDLERAALRELKGRVERFVEARYQGQSHEIRIPEGADFHEAHRRLYGFTRRDPVVIVNAVVRVTSTQPKPRTETFRRAKRPERVGVGGRGHRATSREGLRPGDEVRGPAAIGEETASTWVPSGWTARIDKYCNIIICR